MIQRLIIPALLLLFGFGFMHFLTSFKKPQQRKPPQPVIRTVRTKTVRYQPLTPPITTMGRVIPLELIALTPEVSGRILKHYFRLQNGKMFNKGSILCKIDSAQIFFSLSATISDLQNGVANLIPEYAASLPEARDRWQQFFSALSIDSLPALPHTTSDREKFLAARYSVYKLYYQAKQQKNTLEKHTLYAPFNGTVENTQVYPGSMARSGSSIASLVRTDVLEIEISLAMTDLTFVKKGDQVTVSLPEDSTHTCNGTIDRISAIIDERMQTATAYIRINKPPKALLRPGAFALVQVAGQTLDQAVSFPRKALYDGNFVYVIERDTLAKRHVSIAFTSIDSAYCINGIAEGAQLITEPLQEAVIGMAVQDERSARLRMEKKQQQTPAEKQSNNTPVKKKKNTKNSIAPSSRSAQDAQ